MYGFILKCIKKEVTDDDLENELYEMCDSLHSHCPSDECLMIKHSFVERQDKREKGSKFYSPFIATNSEDYEDPETVGYAGCPFFKRGAKMLRALRRK